MSLKVVSLSKRYNDKWVLRDVSFEASVGEVFGIFGLSASGKTTLLKAIQGVTSLNGGAVHFGTKDVTKSDRTARNFTNVSSARGPVWQRFLKNKRTASRGQRSMQNIQRAIESATSVLLLDDPFCDIDAHGFESLVREIRMAAKERSICVLFASNNFEHIIRACDRVAVLVNGEIKQIGEPQEIFEKPGIRAVAEVTGRNNLFAARRLTSSKAEIPEFLTIDGGHRLFAQRVERGALGALNQNVTLAIRPEQISISFGASFPEDNLLKATVKRVQFLGPTTLIDLDAGGLKLQVLVLRLVGLNVGDECMVGLPPDRIQIFRD